MRSPGQRELVSAKKRWGILGVSVLGVALMFWSAPRFGYLLPLFMSACLVVSNGFMFLASRLKRTDVTNVESRLRQLLFEKI